MNTTYDKPPSSSLKLAGTTCCGRSRIICLWRFAIGLGLSDLSGDGFATTSTRPPLGPSLLLLFILLFGGFGNLDDYLTTVKLYFIEELDSFLSGLCAGKSNKSITRGVVTTHNNLRGKAKKGEEMSDVEAVQKVINLHVALNRRKECLQPFIRCGVCKVASKDLVG